MRREDLVSVLDDLGIEVLPSEGSNIRISRTIWGETPTPHVEYWQLPLDELLGVPFVRITADDPSTPEDAPPAWQRSCGTLTQVKQALRAWRLEGRPHTHATAVEKHACWRGDACTTKVEVHCKCGWAQGAYSLRHAATIVTGHAGTPAATTIPWQHTILAATLTEAHLRELFGRHCECRPLDVQRDAHDHAASHDCDTSILLDVQIALGIYPGNDRTRRAARERCAAAINESREHVHARVP